MSSVTIRRVRADDGPSFRALRLQAIADTPTAFGSTLAETEARPPEYWERRVGDAAADSDAILFAAEDGERWIGLAGGFLTTDGAEPYADLISMWVNPAYRGQGVGQRLVGEVIAWARKVGATRIVLWVTETNRHAIGLYERCGFQATGDTQPLPSHPELMEREMELRLG